MAKKSTKKSAATKGNPAVLTAVIVGSSVVLAPILAYFTSVVALLVLPAISSLAVAVMYKGYVGKDMTPEFRREATTLVAVLGVILVAILSVKFPAQSGLVFSRSVDPIVEPIFMLVYRSLMVIVGTAVAVFLPLSITVKD